jgi:hypothetical protein
MSLRDHSFRAALLGGLDAPTGGQAQSNPHPILMRVQDNAFLPNRYRFKIKECLRIGCKPWRHQLGACLYPARITFLRSP